MAIRPSGAEPFQTSVLPSGERGLALPVARDRPVELSVLYRSGIQDLHAHFERLRVEAEHARLTAQAVERAAQAEARHGTLTQLLATYTDYRQP